MTAMLVSPSSPRTPTTNRYLPTKSSPLTPMASSPTLPHQPSAGGSYYARQRTLLDTPISERRKGQYKGHSSFAQASMTQRRSISGSSEALSRTLSNPFDMSISPATTPSSHHSSTAMFVSPSSSSSQSRSEDPQKSFLRERFKARCFARAQEEREKKIKEKRRYTVSREPSSDGIEMSDDLMADVEEMDEDEDDDEVMNDVFFQRIIASVNRKQEHHYKLSYDRDIGSSFDPSMEEWEEETPEPIAPEPNPPDFDDQELAEYAAEYELLEGLNVEDIFSLSDVDDIEEGQKTEDGDVDMW